MFHDKNHLPQGPQLQVQLVSENLYLVQPQLTHGADATVQAGLLQKLLADFQIREYDAWFYTPMACAFTRGLHPRVVVYDCMDELKNFLHAPPELMNLEQELLQRADVVFTGGRSLYQGKRSHHPHVYLFPSSIDAGHFAQACSTTIQEPADQAALPGPRAGFYGVIDERFDIELLRQVAELRPSVQFVILGPVVKIDPKTLPQAENIHFLGGKNYEELPAYLSGWDVALLPFAICDATRYISPTKTPEYLAAGRRVVSTPIHDVVTDYGKAGLVDIAGTPADFALAIDRAFEPPSPLWTEAVHQTLANMSWDKTWLSMQSAMSDAERRVPLDSRVTTSLKAVPMTLSSTPLTRLSSAPSSLSSSPQSVNLRARKTPEFDVLVVGAGFAGSVLAERLASQHGKRVLIIDQRDHVAGNAYDHLDEHGVLVHRYGPHIFHTNSAEVVTYLSNFTEWRPYEHRVLASVHGKLLPVPINLRTINELYDLDLDEAGMRQFLNQRIVPCAHVRTSEEIVLSRVGRELYETFFRGYTRKQWGLDPSELDPGVAGRIPVRYDTDDRYFSDTFQAMPLHGYTRMFERMLDHPLITVQLGVTYREAMSQAPGAHIVFTGPIDEFFDYRYGALPYRSLEFRHEHHSVERFQVAGVVNYPNQHEYTRITEFKTLTGQQHSGTSIVYEYPRATGDPYYPIPRPQNAALYARYKALADKTPGVTFCGRLANYKYFNMDQVVAQALASLRDMTANTAASQQRSRTQLPHENHTLVPGFQASLEEVTG